MIDRVERDGQLVGRVRIGRVDDDAHPGRSAMEVELDKVEGEGRLSAVAGPLRSFTLEYVTGGLLSAARRPSCLLLPFTSYLLSLSRNDVCHSPQRWT